MNREPHISRVHSMPFGAEVQENGKTCFRFFAPACSSVRLKIAGCADLLTMDSAGNGWHQVETQATAGTKYQFVLPGGEAVPDPASRFQPQDFTGPSEIIDPRSYTWKDGAWQGRDWTEAVVYEVHVGAFTPAGTFLSMIEKLDHLAELGITCVELMAINDFQGRRNWGYDGILLYAPDSSYGRPEGLKSLIDAAHARGLMLVLDVVYNHLGLEGGPLRHYWPSFYSSTHWNAWGSTPNFDAEGSHEVREFILHNALYWLNEFHLDGLRLDASDALADRSTRHILDELADRIRELSGPRNIHLILEDQRDMSGHLQRDTHLNAKKYTAQWNHKMAHLRELVEHERSDDLEEKTEIIAKTIALGFGAASDQSGSGHSCAVTPPCAQIAFLQTHDLVGNDALGRRVYHKGPVGAVRALSALYLLMPQIPMMFMGDQWATSSPFPFFCDYGGQVAEDMVKGRVEFLRKQGSTQEELQRMPDPLQEKTFLSAKLNWAEAASGIHAEWFEWHQKILRVRQEKIQPLLRYACRTSDYEIHGALAFTAHWTFENHADLRLQANLSAKPQAGFGVSQGDQIWAEGTCNGSGELGAWTVCWHLMDMSS